MRARAGATTSPRASGPGAEFMQLVEQVGREKGIDVEILVSAIEDAITTASRKQQERSSVAPPGAVRPSQEILVSRLNRKNGQLDLFARKLIVGAVNDGNLEILLADARKLDSSAEVGGHVEIPRSTKGLGRIEAQAAKQVIFNKVREAERDIVYNDYFSRVASLVNGTVKRFERGDIIVDLGRAEGLLPRRHQSRTELYSQGDRVRAVVVEVNRSSKGPQVVLSRTDPSLLIKLFEMEVPEIYDGTVILRQAVREPGERSKVAVASREKEIDAVGACVGMKGSRVQAIIRELRGEKIDIVQWSDEITALAANALNPAKVSRVVISADNERTLEVVVDELQLSLAIGKKGQNVRLAAKLLGWRIDIKSEEAKRQQIEIELAEMTRRSMGLAEVPGVAAELAEALADAGIKTVTDLLRADKSTLVGLPGISETAALALRTTVEEYVQSARTAVARAAEQNQAADASDVVDDDESAADPAGTN